MGVLPRALFGPAASRATALGLPICVVFLAACTAGRGEPTLPRVEGSLAARPSSLPTASSESGEVTSATQAYGLAYVDHHNLRYLEPDQALLDRQASSITTNLDRAVDAGATSYVLFSRSFEDVLTYDFEVDDVGRIGEQAFPPGHEHRANAKLYRQTLAQVIAQAERRGIDLVMHTNQLEYPEEVLGILPATTAADGTTCPDEEIGWSTYRGKLHEFFGLFPDIGGLQLTADESEISVLACGTGTADEKVRRLVDETVAVAAVYSKTVEVRAWGRIEELGAWSPPQDETAPLAPNEWLSVKNTDGDFQLFADASPLVGTDAPRLIVEFDGWREYSGWNFYPCYIGDIAAERVRMIDPSGERRLSVRLNWSTEANPIFGVPFGNLVNIYALSALATDPNSDPDQILREWIAGAYPDGSHDAAFDLYKRSSEFHRRVSSLGPVETTDHGRLFRSHSEHSAFDRAADALLRLQAAGELTSPEDFAERRADMDAALAGAQLDITRLGIVDADGWHEGLHKGARVLWFVGHGTTDQLELTYWYHRLSSVDTMPDLGDLAEGIAVRAEEWSEWDAASFDLMRGYEAQRMLDALVLEYPAVQP